jgi:hypothetical protein
MQAIRRNGAAGTEVGQLGRTAPGRLDTLTCGLGMLLLVSAAKVQTLIASVAGEMGKGWRDQWRGAVRFGGKNTRNQLTFHLSDSN